MTEFPVFEGSEIQNEDAMIKRTTRPWVVFSQCMDNRPGGSYGQRLMLQALQSKHQILFRETGFCLFDLESVENCKRQMSLAVEQHLLTIHKFHLFVVALCIYPNLRCKTYAKHRINHNSLKLVFKWYHMLNYICWQNILYF